MERNVELFTNTLTLDILEARDYVDWEKIEKKVFQLRREIALLQSLDKEVDPLSDLSDLLTNHPNILRVLQLLIAHTPDQLTLADGRVVNFAKDIKSMCLERAREIAKIFIDIGLLAFLKRVRSLEDCVKGVLIGLEPNVRKNRRGKKFEEVVYQLICNTVKALEREFSVELEVIKNLKVNLKNECKTVDFGIRIKNKAEIESAIEVNFYSTPGSKPSETLPRAYSEIQSKLADKNINLIVISDGKGWIKMRSSIETMLKELKYCFTLKQAKKGYLKQALSEILREKLKKQ